MVAKPAEDRQRRRRSSWSGCRKAKLVEINPAEPYDAVYQFMLLADANETEILAFARSYGPLWVCKRHQIAAFHAPTAGDSRTPPRTNVCRDHLMRSRLMPWLLRIAHLKS